MTSTEKLEGGAGRARKMWLLSKPLYKLRTNYNKDTTMLNAF
jgi:hypothetical protein